MVALASASLVGGSLNVVITLLGVLLWDRVAVVTRAAVIQIRHAEFVAAAQSLGCSTLRILVSEILPNLGGALIVVATIGNGPRDIARSRFVLSRRRTEFDMYRRFF